MPSIYKNLMFFLLCQILVFNFSSYGNTEETFETWLSSYKKFAVKKGVSQETISIAFKNVTYIWGLSYGINKECNTNVR